MPSGPGHSPDGATDLDRTATLAEAAAAAGVSSEALRLRIRRRTLRSWKGQDGRLMVRMGDVLGGGAPFRPTPDRPGQPLETDGLAVHMAAQVEELRRERDGARAELAGERAGRLDDRGRAERAEAERDGERRRADDAEARVGEARERLAMAEADLREARRPLWERVIRAVRGQ